VPRVDARASAPSPRLAARAPRVRDGDSRARATASKSPAVEITAERAIRMRKQ